VEVVWWLHIQSGNLQWINMKYKNMKYVSPMKYNERLIYIVCDGLTLCWCILYAGRMWTELGVPIELHRVLSCDVCYGVYWVMVVNPLFIDQYILLMEDMYEEWFPAVHFNSFVPFPSSWYHLNIPTWTKLFKPLTPYTTNCAIKNHKTKRTQAKYIN